MARQVDMPPIPGSRSCPRLALQGTSSLGDSWQRFPATVRKVKQARRPQGSSTLRAEAPSRRRRSSSATSGSCAAAPATPKLAELPSAAGTRSRTFTRALRRRERSGASSGGAPPAGKVLVWTRTRASRRRWLHPPSQSPSEAFQCKRSTRRTEMRQIESRLHSILHPATPVMSSPRVQNQQRRVMRQEKRMMTIFLHGRTRCEWFAPANSAFRRILNRVFLLTPVVMVLLFLPHCHMAVGCGGVLVVDLV